MEKITVVKIGGNVIDKKLCKIYGLKAKKEELREDA